MDFLQPYAGQVGWRPRPYWRRVKTTRDRRSSLRFACYLYLLMDDSVCKAIDFRARPVGSTDFRRANYRARSLPAPENARRLSILPILLSTSLFPEFYEYLALCETPYVWHCRRLHNRHFGISPQRNDKSAVLLIKSRISVVTASWRSRRASFVRSSVLLSIF